MERSSMDTDSNAPRNTPPPNVPDVTEPATEEPKETQRSGRASPVNCNPPAPKEKLTTLAGHVKLVDLMGVKIVALLMDGQERLCLAQISTTLLNEYSYNEIHNRRVALGITCVQCTPVQLEILRRAGAMPVSSRRCGMITEREAERLCKSFLTDNSPPKLPDNFSFDVQHRCAWGCRGKFVPSRYNSSRAKCVQCVHCRMFFSPNKFIFHSHRFTDSSYTQPDAANFNSWRRHLYLCRDVELPDHIVHAWEDVKAMFNGGTRKRCIAQAFAGHLRASAPFKSEAPIANPVITRPSGSHATSSASATPKKPHCPQYSGLGSASLNPQNYLAPMNYLHQLRHESPADFGWLRGPHQLQSYAALAAALAAVSPTQPAPPPGCWFPYPPVPMNPLAAWPPPSVTRLAPGPPFENTSQDSNEVKNRDDRNDETHPANYSNLTKEKLQEMLMSEMRTRQKLESDLMQLKDESK